MVLTQDVLVRENQEPNDRPLAIAAAASGVMLAAAVVRGTLGNTIMRGIGKAGRRATNDMDHVLCNK